MKLGNHIKGLQDIINAKQAEQQAVVDAAHEEALKMHRAKLAAIKAAQTRRQKEVDADPIGFAILARDAGCISAAQVAGFIARYVEGKVEKALAGPQPLPRATPAKKIPVEHVPNAKRIEVKVNRAPIPVFAPLAKLCHEEG